MQASNIKSCSLINKIFVRKKIVNQKRKHMSALVKYRSVQLDLNGNSVNKSIISQWGESCWATTSIKLFILFALTARF
jgi:hypothetical protein